MLKNCFVKEEFWVPMRAYSQHLLKIFNVQLMLGEGGIIVKDSLTYRPSSQGWAPRVLPLMFLCDL